MLPLPLRLIYADAMTPLDTRCLIFSLAAATMLPLMIAVIIAAVTLRQPIADTMAIAAADA